MNEAIPVNTAEAHTAGRFALREDIRRIMREGIQGDTDIQAADLMREVVQWANTHPLNWLALLRWVRAPYHQLEENTHEPS